MSLDLQQIKARLEQRRAELREQIGGLDQAYPKPTDPTELSEGPQDFEESAIDENEMVDERVILTNNQALLEEVEDALKRLEQGTYGICVVCGQPIPEKRLEAIPWAARCVKDEEQLERRNLGV
jgi:DnaK suppressor protein